MVTYTAIFGGYDIFREGGNEGRKVLFTDSKEVYYDTTPWEVVHCGSRAFDDPTRAARHKKALSHHLFPTEEYSLWVDGSLELKQNFNEELLKSILGDFDMAIYPHNQRNCAYQEARACKKHNKDSHDVIDTQMKRYREDGFPEGMGLPASAFLIRRNTPQVSEFNDMWWDEIQRGSKRDQLSFNYCLWKLGMEVKWIRSGNIFKNAYFDVHRYHPREGE